jgi:hypothetical protein
METKTFVLPRNIFSETLINIFNSTQHRLFLPAGSLGLQDMKIGLRSGTSSSATSAVIAKISALQYLSQENIFKYLNIFYPRFISPAFRLASGDPGIHAFCQVWWPCWVAPNIFKYLIFNHNSASGFWPPFVRITGRWYALVRMPLRCIMTASYSGIMTKSDVKTPQSRPNQNH